MATSPPSSRAPVPERLGRFDLQGVVGSGALGVVYKSYDSPGGRPVAIRTLRHDLSDDAERAGFTARLQHAAQAAGRLAHPGIVAVYEYGEHQAQPYLALEYVDGGSLRQYLERRRRFDVVASISLLAQVLDALHYAHEQGVWHCDLQPANILIDRNGSVKLTDFGIAHVEDSGPSDHAGAALGTPGFIAPEVYLGARYDRRVDIFAAGVVAYQLLAEAPPFPGPADNVMYRVCYQTPAAPSVVARNPSLRPYDAPVMQALAKRPPERFASAEEFRSALAHAHGEAPLPALPARALAGDLPELVPLRPAPAAGSGARAAGTREAAPASATRLEMPGWDGERLARIDLHLARFIGPVSRVMVKRAATQARDESELLQWLADNAVAPRDRAEFLRLDAAAADPLVRATRPRTPEADGQDARRGAPTRPGPAGTLPGPGTLPARGDAMAADAARATQLLTTHLGPIAQVLVRRASAEPDVTREKFLRGLALLLSRDQDRASFLAEFGFKP